MSQVNVKAVITAEDKTGAALRGFEAKITQLGTSALHLAKNMAVLGGAAAVTATIFGVKMASEFEQTFVAFETMLGSGKKATILLKDLQNLAVKTPFTLTEVNEAAKQLLAYGIEAKDITDLTGRLGDMAMGSKVKFDSLALALGQTKAKTRLAGQEMLQFTNAGVGLRDELAKRLGVSVKNVDKLMEKGKITYQDVQAVIVKMTSQGGRFYKMNEKMAKTFGGTISNLKDNLQLFARDVMGVSASGEIKKGGIFYYIKTGAENLLGFLNKNKQAMTDAFNKIVTGTVSFATKAIQELKDAYNEIQPTLKDFWRRIRDDLIPALEDLYNNYIKPLIPAIRDFLVGAIKFLIEWLGKLITFFAEHKDWILGLIVLWGTLKTAMMIDNVVTAVVNALKIMMVQYQVFAIQAGTDIGGIKGAFASLKAYIGGPMGAAFLALQAVALGALIAIATKAFDVIGTLNQTKQALGIFDKTAAQIDAKVLELQKKQIMGTITAAETKKLAGLIKIQSTLPTLAKANLNSAYSDQPRTGIPQYAVGGMYGGGPMMVGEQGPEMIIPNRSGQVIPNHQLKGGAGVNLTVNIGSFSGSAIERRKLAKLLYSDLKQMGLAT